MARRDIQSGPAGQPDRRPTGPFRRRFSRPHRLRSGLSRGSERQPTFSVRCATGAKRVFKDLAPSSRLRVFAFRKERRLEVQCAHGEALKEVPPIDPPIVGSSPPGGLSYQPRLLQPSDVEGSLSCKPSVEATVNDPTPWGFTLTSLPGIPDDLANKSVTPVCLPLASGTSITKRSVAFMPITSATLT